VRASLFIFLALFLDLLQYLAGTTVWFLYFRHKERQGTLEEEQFLAPREMNWPTWTLFYSKATSMLVAYAVYIIPFLASKFLS